jgi:predicted O-methyltransferase YrrM
MPSVFIHFVKWCLGIEQASTQTTNAERCCMAKYAAGKRRLAEIGVWEGVTTAQLRNVMADNGIYFAVDPYPVGKFGFSTQKIIAKGSVGKIRKGKVVWLRMTGVESAKEFAVVDKPFDFLFIDGDHSFEGLKGNWEAWKRLMSIGGIVALHDSRSTEHRKIEEAGSVRYTQTTILHDPEYRVVETVDSLTILERVK